MFWVAAPALLMIVMLVLCVGRLELHYRRGLARGAGADAACKRLAAGDDWATGLTL